MDVDYEDALGYPLRGDDALVRHLIGGGAPALLSVGYVFVTLISLLLPFFWVLNLLLYALGLVVSLFWTGYFVRVARRTYAGDPDPPAVDDWGDLLRDGGYGFLIGLVYSIPLILITIAGVVAFALLLGGGLSLGQDSSGLAAGLGVAGVLVGLAAFAIYCLYSLVMGYLMPVSLCAYADDGTLSAAFDTDRLKRVGLRSEYALTWVGYMVVSAVVQGFVWTLATVLIGYLLLPFLPFLYFFGAMAMYYVFAQVYADEMDLAVAEPVVEV